MAKIINYTFVEMTCSPKVTEGPATAAVKALLARSGKIAVPLASRTHAAPLKRAAKALKAKIVVAPNSTGTGFNAWAFPIETKDTKKVDESSS